MAVREMATTLEVEQLYNATTGAAANTDGVDGADFELGLTFLMSILAYTTGDFVFSLEESDDDAATDPYVAVPARKIVHPNGVQVDGNNFSDSLGAVTANGDLAVKLGVFSNKRFVRAVIAGTNTPVADVLIQVIKSAENLAAGVTDPADASD